MPHRIASRLWILIVGLTVSSGASAAGSADDIEFFERKIRPLLVDHCYECHSEQAGERQGGLLLDRPIGWLEGGQAGKAVVPGDTESSLLITAIRYQDEDLQMPPDGELDGDQIELFERWVLGGAIAPEESLESSEFVRLGDQTYLFDQARTHWAFQPVASPSPPTVRRTDWNRSPIDQFVFARLAEQNLTPSPPAAPETLIRRLHHDLTGLPPNRRQIDQFVRAAEVDREAAVQTTIDRLLQTPDFGQHIGRMWLDVTRYADTDSAYRPDTRTPHYFPFAFTYRDYVVDAFNRDKPFDRFLTEQMAADLLGYGESSPELAALGFYAVGPHANRSQVEALDDWIDLTTRGLMGVTAACARCHDHKFEPVPTADYYALRGVFAAVSRPNPLDERKLPELQRSDADPADVADYEERRAKLDARIKAAAGKQVGGNNRSVAEKIRETELAELLAFHPGAPDRAMVVTDKPKPPPSFVFVRGDAGSRGEPVSRRFLSILDPAGEPFADQGSGRLELAGRITDPDNPLTARVFVNRVWGHLIGSHLVATPSDFGLQGAPPTHPELLDWLANDFIRHQGSVKHLVRTIARSQVYGQSSANRPPLAEHDPQNRLLWRANRKHLTIEAIRDAMLCVSDDLDRRLGGRPGELWDRPYTVRRAIYGFINRFNLDPTLRAFDFPTPMQTQPGRGESIVAPQALFLMNSPFVIDRAASITRSNTFLECETDSQRTEVLFSALLQRPPTAAERTQIEGFVDFHDRFKPVPRFIQSPWPLVAQSLLMSNEFQYVD